MKRLALILLAVMGFAMADVVLDLGTVAFDSAYKDTALADSEFVTALTLSNSIANQDTHYFRHNTAADSTFNLFLAMATGDSAFWTILAGRNAKVTMKDTVLLPLTAYLGAVDADSMLVTKQFVRDSGAGGTTDTFWRGYAIVGAGTYMHSGDTVAVDTSSLKSKFFATSDPADSIYQLWADTVHYKVLSPAATGSTDSLYTGVYIGPFGGATWLLTGDTINVDTSQEWPNANLLQGKDTTWVKAAASGLNVDYADTIQLARDTANAALAAAAKAQDTANVALDSALHALEVARDSAGGTDSSAVSGLVHDTADVLRGEMGDTARTAASDTATALRGAMGDTARAAVSDTATVLRGAMGDTARAAVSDTASVLRGEMGDTARAAVNDTASVLRGEMGDTARAAVSDTASVLRGEMGDTARAAVSDTATVLRGEMGDTARVAAGDTATALRGEMSDTARIAAHDTADAVRGDIADTVNAMTIDAATLTDQDTGELRALYDSVVYAVIAETAKTLQGVDTTYIFGKDGAGGLDSSEVSGLVHDTADVLRAEMVDTAQAYAGGISAADVSDTANAVRGEIRDTLLAIGPDSIVLKEGTGIDLAYANDTITMSVDTSITFPHAGNAKNADSLQHCSITMLKDTFGGAAIDQQARDTATAALRFAERDSLGYMTALDTGKAALAAITDTANVVRAEIRDTVAAVWDSTAAWPGGAVDDQAQDTAAAALRFAERDSLAAITALDTGKAALAWALRDSVRLDGKQASGSYASAIYQDTASKALEWALRDSVRLDGKLETGGKAADATGADSASFADSTKAIPDSINGVVIATTRVRADSTVFTAMQATRARADSIVVANAMQGPRFRGHVMPMCTTIANPANVIVNADRFDCVALTGQAQTCSLKIPSGTPVGGQKLIVRVKDAGVSQTLGWNPIYVAFTGITLSTATTAGKTMYWGFVYNSTDSKWDCLASQVAP